jgi:hypothetical protein
MNSEKKANLVKKLYNNDKKFKKLFNLMFNDFGWSATEIDQDVLAIYKIFKGEKKRP